MAPASNPSTPAALVPRRRWVRWAAWMTAGAGLLLLLLPTLMAFRPLRAVVLRLATLGQPVRVSMDRLSLGWGSPTRVEGLTIADPQGAPILRVAHCATPLSLSELLLTSRAGTVELHEPELFIRVERGRSNLAKLTTSGGARQGRQQLRVPNRSLRVVVSAARVDWLDPGKRHAWGVAPLDLRAGLAHDPHRPLPAAFLEAGTIFQQVQLSAQMCDDVLKFVAPNLAHVTQAQGAFSLDVDGGHVLLGDLATGQFAGRLKIHHAQVGAGPLIREIAHRLRLPAEMQLDDDSEIQFALAEGRVHHAGLRFRVGPLALRTSGSVGLDQSLDLLAELPFPTHWVGSGPLRDALAGKSLRLPIRGTLKQPKLGMPAAAATEEDRLLTALLNALSGDQPVDEATLEQRLIEEGIIPAAERLIDALGRLRERRQSVRAGQHSTDEDPAAGDAPHPTPPADRERLFRRRRNRRPATTPTPQSESL